MDGKQNRIRNNYQLIVNYYAGQNRKTKINALKNTLYDKISVLIQKRNNENEIDLAGETNGKTSWSPSSSFFSPWKPGNRRPRTENSDDDR